MSSKLLFLARLLFIPRKPPGVLTAGGQDFTAAQPEIPLHIQGRDVLEGPSWTSRRIPWQAGNVLILRLEGLLEN